MAKLCFFALLAAILSVTLSDLNPKFKGVFQAGAGVIFFLFFLRYLSPIRLFFGRLIQELGRTETFQPLLQGLGIAFLVSLTASFCRDLGEEKVAGKLELCGKGALFCLALPILESLLDLMGEFLP